MQYAFSNSEPHKVVLLPESASSLFQNNKLTAAVATASAAIMASAPTFAANEMT